MDVVEKHECEVVIDVDNLVESKSIFCLLKTVLICDNRLKTIMV